MFLAIYILFYLTANPFHLVETEQVYFSVIRNGKNIGEVTASQVIEGNQTKYFSKTETNVKLMRNINIKYISEVYIDNGHLDSSEARVSVNGRDHTHTRTVRAGEPYQIIVDGESKSTLEKPITYTSVMLLFEEPLTASYSYSEKTGDLHPIRNLGNHTYEKTDARGRVNRYYYEHGQLLRADIDSGFFKFALER